MSDGTQTATTSGKSEAAGSFHVLDRESPYQIRRNALSMANGLAQSQPEKRHTAETVIAMAVKFESFILEALAQPSSVQSDKSSGMPSPSGEPNDGQNPSPVATAANQSGNAA